MLGQMARKYGLPVALREPGGRQRRPDFRRPQRRIRRAGRTVRAGQGFRRGSAGGGSGRPEPAAIAADDFTPEAEIWNALVLGVRDYARKTRFRKVLLGLSGGIDSALTAAIAADAMGPENVLGRDDAVALFEPGQRGRFGGTGAQSGHPDPAAADSPHHGNLRRARWRARSRDCKPDVTEENIQSRIRGNLLMALSNKYGSLLLTTGNKSEMAVGYCTLYGDMNGGLAVIADLPKMMVYRVSRWRNQRGADIPESTLTKAPSAELRPDQTDQDSLPPYEVLDRDSGIAHRAVPIRGRNHRARVSTRRRSAGSSGWCGMRSSRRKQAAPVLKVTSRAFGTGWRMPIVRQE